MKTAELSNLLYEIDPLDTMCNCIENMEDKYDDIAETVMTLVTNYDEFISVLTEVLFDADENCRGLTTEEIRMINEKFLRLS